MSAELAPPPATPVEGLLDRVSQSPRLWNMLRWLVEAGFYGEKRVIAEELRPFDTPERRFLDVGCGTGAFAACFPAARYVGIDVSRTYLRYAGQSRQGAFVACSGDGLALTSASFDAALVLGVLHHLPDAIARRVMHEVQRVLRPSATALVIEDIPPPDLWNLAGHAMHAIDRGGYIRSEADYRAVFGDGFAVTRFYTMRSGICDYGVYVLTRL